ncbi:MAG: UDP-N-acetylmuramoyl-L-alanyl-D-glutamate--2,6-diaminopimelate ligase [Firmicutes bacterium]|nr:UDP-N-acetylmuramoyl-L-alanyl-D-glutamate--2,6-diaminopimelate ligase [Bacillota bacterium]
MMKLNDLLRGLKYELLQGDAGAEISKLEYDSRKIGEGDAFVCVKGYQTDGHGYAGSAAEKGAKVIICQDEVAAEPGITYVRVEDTRKALAVAASNFYGNPKDRLKLIGVTGTNGKTTSTFIIKSILEAAGFKTAIIGTIANYIGERKLEASRTTPESLELHKLFRDMADEGVKYCVMEVSSHSLYLDRVYGLEFSQGIFTNLTQDHLDFHETFENYYKAKLMLFQNSLNSVINLDSEYGSRLLGDIQGRVTTYSAEKEADVAGSSLRLHSRGVEFSLAYKGESRKININIPGKYNVENALGSAAACLSEGITLDTVKQGLEKMLCVPGRCEIVNQGFSLGFDIIVDYAHTPDGLENILETAREFTEGRLIAVFGCGGDRDRTKRPIMGRIGTDLSDIAIITSDNPRTEDPEAIIKDVVAGISKDNYIIVENRREAIKKSIELARSGDVIVIAGKGHEDYQILKTGKIHFDEREIVKEILEEGGY